MLTITDIPRPHQVGGTDADLLTEVVGPRYEGTTADTNRVDDGRQGSTSNLPYTVWRADDSPARPASLTRKGELIGVAYICQAASCVAAPFSARFERTLRDFVNQAWGFRADMDNLSQALVLVRRYVLIKHCQGQRTVDDRRPRDGLWAGLHGNVGRL